MLKFLLFLVAAIFSTGCSFILPDRSYLEEMERDSDPFFNPGKDFKVINGDAGDAYRSRSEIKKRTPASLRESAKMKESESLSKELEDKEAEIPDELQGQYAKDKKYLLTESDKLYYLSLSIPERSSYIRTKKQDMREDLGKNQDFIERQSIHHAELYVGMSKKEVRQAWGKAVKVEVAGDPRNENERWSYVEDGNVKYVYIDGGKVQGWAIDI